MEHVCPPIQAKYRERWIMEFPALLTLHCCLRTLGGRIPEYFPASECCVCRHRNCCHGNAEGSNHGDCSSPAAAGHSDGCRTGRNWKCNLGDLNQIWCLEIWNSISYGTDYTFSTVYKTTCCFFFVIRKLFTHLWLLWCDLPWCKTDTSYNFI